MKVYKARINKGCFLTFVGSVGGSISFGMTVGCSVRLYESVINFDFADEVREKVSF